MNEPSSNLHHIGYAEVKPLPSKKTSTRPTNSKDTPIASCSICFDPIDLPHILTPSPTLLNEHNHTLGLEKPVTIVTCGHVFGERCLSKWMDVSNTCPLCRLEFYEKEEQLGYSQHEFFESWRGVTMMSGLAILDRDWEDAAAMLENSDHREEVDEDALDDDIYVEDAAGRTERSRSESQEAGRRVGGRRRGALRTFFL